MSVPVNPALGVKVNIPVASSSAPKKPYDGCASIAYDNAAPAASEHYSDTATVCPSPVDAEPAGTTGAALPPLP